MTIEGFLNAIEVRSGVQLIHCINDLTNEQKKAIKASPYLNAPYVLLESDVYRANVQLLSKRSIGRELLRVYAIQQPDATTGIASPTLLDALVQNLYSLRSEVTKLNDDIPLRSISMIGYLDKFVTPQVNSNLKTLLTFQLEIQI